MYERLSSPLSALKPHYDVAVVGSGYGASVAAARLASAGRSVCVLERGREIAVGEFPASITDMQRESKSAQLRAYRQSAGLFDIRLGKDVHVAMGCGLGGTSLINANVCLEPDPRVLEDPRWPQPVRADGMLAEGLARARTMLRPKPYPGLRKLLKLEQLGASANALGGELSLPPLHIAFAHGPNAAGLVQNACTLCGDCCGGCNVGAKTTTTLTYLPTAGRTERKFSRASWCARCQGRGWQMARQYRDAPRGRLGDPIDCHGRHRRIGRGHAGLDRDFAQVQGRRVWPSPIA